MHLTGAHRSPGNLPRTSRALATHQGSTPVPPPSAGSLSIPQPAHGAEITNAGSRMANMRAEWGTQSLAHLLLNEGENWRQELTIQPRQQSKIPCPPTCCQSGNSEFQQLATDWKKQGLGGEDGSFNFLQAKEVCEYVCVHGNVCVSA